MDITVNLCRDLIHHMEAMGENVFKLKILENLRINFVATFATARSNIPLDRVDVFVIACWNNEQKLVHLGGWIVVAHH